MNKVTICLIVHDEYLFTTHQLENLGLKVCPKEEEFLSQERKHVNQIYNVQVELLVAIKQSTKTDKRFNDYFINIVNADYLVEVPITESDGAIYNKLFKQATCDYVCIINQHVYLQKHWLTELLYHHKNIENSGVVSITDSTIDCDYSPLLSLENDIFINAFVPENHYVYNNGVCLFLRQHLFLVGAFDESPELYKHELVNYQLRCFALGYTNYYIPTQSCVILKDNQNIDYELNVLAYKFCMKKHYEMKKTKHFYIPL
jgi:hypothetical protein